MSALYRPLHDSLKAGTRHDLPGPTTPARDNLQTCTFIFASLKFRVQGYSFSYFDIRLSSLRHVSII
jgi:hypothetical protein